MNSSAGNAIKTSSSRHGVQGSAEHSAKNRKAMMCRVKQLGVPENSATEQRTNFCPGRASDNP